MQTWSRSRATLAPRPDGTLPSPLVVMGHLHPATDALSLCLAQPNKHQQRNIHHHQKHPQRHRRHARNRPVTHLNRLSTALVPHGHVPTAASEPDQRRTRDGQNHAERDLGAHERVADALASDGASDDDARSYADAACDEAADPRLDGPAELALGDHLAGDGADDAGGGAREEQGEGEDGTGEGGERAAEESVDVEEGGVCVGGADGGVGRVEGGARDDEDGAVDEEGEGGEGEGQLRRRDGQAVPDGGE